MIDFTNAAYVKLSPWDVAHARAELGDVLVADEAVHLAFKGIRDSVVFTSKRLVLLNVQGITGKKKDYTSLPYSRIQAFSVETAGHFDLDAELKIWVSSHDTPISKQFGKGVDVYEVQAVLSAYVAR